MNTFHEKEQFVWFISMFDQHTNDADIGTKIPFFLYEVNQSKPYFLQENDQPYT